MLEQKSLLEKLSLKILVDTLHKEVLTEEKLIKLLQWYHAGLKGNEGIHKTHRNTNHE